MKKALLTLDLQHLSMLSLLLQEWSVTRVAAKLNQPQPAVSRMLHRLREVMEDPLFVRSGSKLVPTERALAMRGPLREILAQLNRLEVEVFFDPATSSREFRIASADCIEPSLLPQLITSLVCAGPRIRAKLRLIDPAYDVTRALEDGELDLAIDNDPGPSEHLRTSTLYVDDVVCVMRSGHPLACRTGIELAEYLSLKHLAPHPSTTRHLGVIDSRIAKAGYRRTITATVPEFNLAPQVLTRCDLVLTTGRAFAEYYARSLPLCLVPAPKEFPPIKFYQLWHERAHESASNRWLRKQGLEIVKSALGQRQAA
jgi:DNA-binding transcriptional LysR family regulator